MNLFIYILAYPLILFLKYAPFRLLYILSDILSFFLHRIFKYRIDVVKENLLMAFPEKTEKERNVIERKSYTHFCDTFFELLRSSTLSAKEKDRRFKFLNPEILAPYEQQSIINLLAHYNSWEWSLFIKAHYPNEVAAVYTRVQNKYFEKLIKQTRESSGGKLYERAAIASAMIRNKSKNIQGFYCFVSDQSPMVSNKTNYWREFFGVKVPCYAGFELLARKLDTVVVFSKVTKIKRGYYECELELITDKPSEVPKHSIVNAYYDLLEEQIKKQPENYLWTHKRWKHRDLYHEYNPE